MRKTSQTTIAVLVTLTSAFCPQHAAAQVQMAWRAAYNNPSDDFAQATHLVLDGAGGAVVLGMTSFTSTSNNDIYLESLDSSGTVVWGLRIDGGFDDVANAMAKDSTGNIYIAGSLGVDSTITHRAAALVKISPLGAEQWRRTFYVPSLPNSVAPGLAIDQSDNAYICGTSSSPGTGAPSSGLLIKYAPNGDALWTKTAFGGTSSGLVRVGIDNANNVYVTGTIDPGATPLSTIKFDSDGNQQWLSQSSGSTPVDLKVDPAGSVYVLSVINGGGSNFNFLTLKYNTAGVLQWSKTYDGTSHLLDLPNAIAFDSTGNTYVTGVAIDGSPRIPTWHTLKYDLSGTLLWDAAQPAGTGTSTSNAPFAITFDAAENLYVTGRLVASGASHCATIKYHPDGQKEWQANYNAPYNNDDAGSDVKVDADGTVFVAGWSQIGPSKIEWSMLKYIPGCPANCVADGKIDGQDDAEFVNCLLGTGCPCSDMNFDGKTDVSDVDLFVAAVMNTGTCP